MRSKLYREYNQVIKALAPDLRNMGRSTGKSMLVRLVCGAPFDFTLLDSDPAPDTTKGNAVHPDERPGGEEVAGGPR